MSARKVWESDPFIEIKDHKPVEMSLDACIKCNICVTACPVTTVTDLFPGPKYEAPQSGRFRQPMQDTADHSVDYCSGCRVCNMVCPTGVRIAEINARARAIMVQQGQQSGRNKLRNNLLARPELLGKISGPVAPLANMALQNPIGGWLGEKVLGIKAEAALPSFSRERFSRWLNKRPKPDNAKYPIVFFHGCSTEYYESRVGKAAVYVLEANGFEVVAPKQNCCGLPLLSNGEFEAARGYHERNVGSLASYVKAGYIVVGTSTSCTLTLKEEAPELLDAYSPDSQLLAANTFDIHEFLTLLLAEGALKTEGLRSIPLRLPYHAPCQFKAHRLGRPSVEIMALIPQLEIVESQAACCGIAGTYGYKSEKYQIAMDVGRPLFEFVDEVDGPLVVCDSETCRWQISRATDKPAVHPIELLAAAYGYTVERPLADWLSIE